VPYILQT